MSERLPDTIRTIAFQAAGYTFALPMQAILKVSQCPPLADSQADEVGLLQLGTTAIALLDLEQLVGARAAGDSEARGQFLILVRAPSGEPYGIQIDELPNMLDIPSRAIRPLPAAAQSSPLRRVAKYAALWQAHDQEHIIFLLDLSLAARPVASRR